MLDCYARHLLTTYLNIRKIARVFKLFGQAGCMMISQIEDAPELYQQTRPQSWAAHEEDMCRGCAARLPDHR